MRKQSTSFFFMIILFLGGCMNQDSAATVEEMYKAALNRDGEQVDKLFSQFTGYDAYYLDELMDNLSWDVMAVDGIENMNIKPVKNNQVHVETAAELTDMYGENWELVASQIDVDDIYVWVVKELSGDYFVVDVEGFDQEEFQEILK